MQYSKPGEISLGMRVTGEISPSVRVTGEISPSMRATGEKSNTEDWEKNIDI